MLHFFRGDRRAPALRTLFSHYLRSQTCRRAHSANTSNAAWTTSSRAQSRARATCSSACSRRSIRSAKWSRRCAPGVSRLLSCLLTCIWSSSSSLFAFCDLLITILYILYCWCRLLWRYCESNELPDSFPYRAKAIFAFQQQGDSEIIFFGVHVQEYGSDCPAPNTRYIVQIFLYSNHTQSKDFMLI